jgi:hypothetical protein
MERTEDIMNDSQVLVIVFGSLAYVLYFGGFGLYVACQKGREPLEGILVGILAGPVGLLIVATLPAIAGAPKASASVRAPVASAPSSR